jgi:hypothetical protein
MDALVHGIEFLESENAKLTEAMIIAGLQRRSVAIESHKLMNL